VDSAISLPRAFVDRLLLRKESIKLPIALGSELVEPANSCHSLKPFYRSPRRSLTNLTPVFVKWDCKISNSSVRI
ncbi:MAG: hypothetical protein ACR2P1_19570, partial [Pseudomonadales bacterium]